MFCLECGSGSVGIHIGQDLPNSTLKMGPCMYIYLSTFGLKTNEGPISCCVEKSLPGSDRSSSQEPVSVGKGRNDGSLY